MTVTLLDRPAPVDGVTRRQFLAGSAAGALLAGCGGSDSRTPEAPSGAGVPVTIEHKYGSTEIPATPQRVVTVGLTDQDPVLALGVTPVGITYWYGEFPSAGWPWRAGPAGSGRRAGSGCGGAIRAGPGGASRVRWGQHGDVGLGSRDLHPKGPDDLRFTAMAMLGFEAPAEITRIVSDPAYPGNVSAERLGLFDADVLFWFAGDAPDHPGCAPSSPRTRFTGSSMSSRKAATYFWKTRQEAKTC